MPHLWNVLIARLALLNHARENPVQNGMGARKLTYAAQDPILFASNTTSVRAHGNAGRLHVLVGRACALPVLGPCLAAKAFLDAAASRLLHCDRVML